MCLSQSWTDTAAEGSSRFSALMRQVVANILRRQALPRSIRHWSLTTLREKLVKVGAKVVRHSRYVIFQLAEVAVPGELFAATLSRIQRLAPVPT